jgi:hypothetical protein
MPETQVLHEKHHNFSKNTSDNVKDNVRDKEIKIKEVDKSFSSVQNPISKAVMPEDVKKTLSERYSADSLDKSSSEQEKTVSIWDFAGQHLYYASHPVFFSPRAVYVLVYNLEKDLEAEADPCARQGLVNIKLDNHDKHTNLEAILSWLVSVHSARPKDDRRNIDTEELPYLRPPVIIVGTHADCPFDEPKKMEAIIQTSLIGKTYDEHVIRPFITVNNTLSSNDDGVRKVRDKVKELFGTEPYMGEYVPVRWFKFEQVSAFLKS